MNLNITALKEVAVLTLGERVYENKLQMLRKVYARCHNIAKEFEKQLEQCKTKLEASDVGIKCMDAMNEIVQSENDTSTLR